MLRPVRLWRWALLADLCEAPVEGQSFSLLPAQGEQFIWRTLKLFRAYSFENVVRSIIQDLLQDPINTNDRAQWMLGLHRRANCLVFGKDWQRMDLTMEMGSRISTKTWKFIVDNFLFGRDSEAFGDSDSFLKHGIIDSTGILELIEYLEGTFGIEIREEEMIPENLDSLANIASFVCRKTMKSVGS
jgi:acyl carrier protein